MREVFGSISVKDAQVTSLTPRDDYAPLFVLDRRERFDGEMGVIWLPGQVSGYLVTPRLKELIREMREPIPSLVASGPLSPRS